MMRIVREMLADLPFSIFQHRRSKFEWFRNWAGKNGKSLQELEATFIFSDSKTAVGYFLAGKNNIAHFQNQRYIGIFMSLYMFY